MGEQANIPSKGGHWLPKCRKPGNKADGLQIAPWREVQ